MSCAHHPACGRPAPPRPWRPRDGGAGARGSSSNGYARLSVLSALRFYSCIGGGSLSGALSLPPAGGGRGDESVRRQEGERWWSVSLSKAIRGAQRGYGTNRSVADPLQGHFPSVDHYLAHAVFKNPLNKGLAILAAPSLTSLETFVLMMTDRNLYKYTPAYKRVWQSVRTYYTLKLTTL